jgi:hypothetical protein
MAIYILILICALVIILVVSKDYDKTPDELYFPDQNAENEKIVLLYAGLIIMSLLIVLWIIERLV